MTRYVSPTPPGMGFGLLVSTGGAIGGGIGLVIATAIHADFALAVVFGACVGVLCGLILEIALAAHEREPGPR
jgi:hypothetical protein